MRKLILAMALIASTLTITQPATAEVPGLDFTDTGCEGYSDAVARLYTAGLGREPEVGGYLFWLDAYQAGTWNLFTMAEFFIGSPEFQRTYGNVSNQEFVELLYRNILGREGEASGVAFWTNELNLQFRSRPLVLLNFSESPENIQRSETTPPTLGPFNFGLRDPWSCDDPIYRDSATVIAEPTTTTTTAPATTTTAAPATTITVSPTTIITAPSTSTTQPAPTTTTVAPTTSTTVQVGEWNDSHHETIELMEVRPAFIDIMNGNFETPNEWIQIRNEGTRDITFGTAFIDFFTEHDRLFSYDLDGIMIPAGQDLYLHTTCGTTTAIDFYWCDPSGLVFPGETGRIQFRGGAQDAVYDIIEFDVAS